MAKLDEIPRLLRVLAAQAANIFVAEKTGNKLALNRATVRSYTELLETVFLIHQVPAWRPGLGARELQKPKVYFVDTGLLADQLGANEDRVANDQQIVGKMLENFVGVELLKHLTWSPATSTSRRSGVMRCAPPVS